MRVSFAEAAEPYLARRWAVFPVSRDKRPLTKHGYRDASTSPDQIEKWSLQHPGCNIAIATGRISGIIVLDVDGAEGEASLLRLEEDTGIYFPPGPSALTGRGRHIYMKYDRHMRSSAGKLAPGLDIRSDGGSIIAPPSIHKSGAEYRWASEGPLEHFPLAALLLLYRPRVRISRPSPHQYDLRELTARVAGARPGYRNNELNAAAYLAGRMVAEGAVTEDEALEAMVSAGVGAGLSHAESLTTATSGIKAGMC